MANDVFGRPMDEKPTTYPVNHNIAPNPMGPGPQNDQIQGFAPKGWSGVSGGFSAERAASESLGARQHISASIPRNAGPSEGGGGSHYDAGDVMDGMNFNHSMDGKLMAPAVPRG